MVSILAFAHIILSVFLVILVLIQDPKGGGAGGMFGGGGGSNSLFGATGAPSFLSQVTRWVAGLFAVMCISMTIFIKPTKNSVLDSVALPAASAPVTETETSETTEPPTEKKATETQPAKEAPAQ